MYGLSVGRCESKARDAGGRESAVAKFFALSPAVHNPATPNPAVALGDLLFTAIA